MVDIALLQSVSYIAGALGVCVAAFYNVMTLRVQQANMKSTLETRQAQLIMNIAQSTWSKEALDGEYECNKIKLENVDDIKKLLEDKDQYVAWRMYASKYEAIGVLVRNGLVDVNLVSQYISGNVISFWERYGKAIGEMRSENNWARLMVELEYLYGRIVEYGGEHPELGIASPIHFDDK